MNQEEIKARAAIKKEILKEYVPKKDFEDLQKRVFKFNSECPECGTTFQQQIKPKEDKFIQSAFTDFQRKGTEGAFTAYAKKFGYDTPAGRRKFAKKIKREYEAWERGGKRGRAPYTLTTFRRAVFLLNIEGRDPKKK